MDIHNPSSLLGNFELRQDIQNSPVVIMFVSNPARPEIDSHEEPIMLYHV